MDGIDIVGVDPRNERCLRLIGIFSQIFTTYVWNYSDAIGLRLGVVEAL